MSGAFIYTVSNPQGFFKLMLNAKRNVMDEYAPATMVASHFVGKLKVIIPKRFIAYNSWFGHFSSGFGKSDG